MIQSNYIIYECSNWIHVVIAYIVDRKKDGCMANSKYIFMADFVQHKMHNTVLY